MGLMSRNKGKAGERELCQLLREAFPGNKFERNSMQAHGAERSGCQWDILTDLPVPLELECKRTEAFGANKWLQQARSQSKGGLPVVAHRSNGQPWRFLLELTGPEFIRLVQALLLFQRLPREVQQRLIHGGPASDLLPNLGDE